MRQLTPLEAGLLEVESPTNLGHLTTVLVLDPSTTPGGLTFDHLKSELTRRLPLVPALRRRLHELPWSVDRPYWIEDANFDLDFHVRYIAVPPPGDEADVRDLVARIHERPLDRSRPMWELYLIHGLAGDRMAILAKIHHAAVGGLYGEPILTALIDRRDPPPPDTWRPELPPDDRALLVKAAVDNLGSPRAWMKAGRDLIRLVPGVGMVVGARSSGRTRLSGATYHEPPRMRFNRALSSHRRWATASLSVKQVRRTHKQLGVTFNDAVVSVCAGALRSWLISRDELPPTPLVALVPITVAAPGTTRDPLAAIVVGLATDQEDPTLRLCDIHDSMSLAVADHGALNIDVIRDLEEASPSLGAMVAALVARTGLAERFQPRFNLVIANIPGPERNLTCFGARLEHEYTLSPIIDGAGLSISVHSHGDHLDFSLVSDRDAVPDLVDLAERIPEAFGELRRLGKAAATNRASRSDSGPAGGTAGARAAS